jgi:hypothetical protein
MTNERQNLESTAEMAAWKISLTKLEAMGMEPRKGSLIGWAAQEPEEGQPYIVLLDKSSGLKTSPVQEVEKIDNGFIIRTKNSIYQIEHIQRARITRYPRLEPI